MADSCAICAKKYSSLEQTISEKPIVPGRTLYCCGRSICSKCLNQEKRYETYCVFCQISSEPSVLPQGLRDPPAYSSIIEHVERPLDSNDEPPAYSADQRAQLFRRTPSGKDHAPDVLHFVTPNDSMHSLALAYGVPIDVMRKVNNVYSDHLLHGRRTVLIPGEYYKGQVSLSPRPIEGEEEEARKQKVRRWMVGCKVAE